MKFGIEYIVDEEETDEGRNQLGAWKMEMDTTQPTLQLSRDKSYGGANSTPGFNGAETVGESEPKAWATSVPKCCRNNSAKLPEKAVSAPGSAYCGWEVR